MDDPHGLRTSPRPDEQPVQLVLEAGRAVLLDAHADLEGEAVLRSGILDRYIALMTHPALVARTALREAVDAESEADFYGWFDPHGNPASEDAPEAHYRFDVAAFAQSLRDQWRTDGCVLAELRRDDSRRGYVAIQVTVRAPLGAVREVEALSAWRLEPLPAV